MFADLHDAGRQLAAALDDTADLVVGLVAGGMPAAFEVAKHLDLPLETLLLTRLVATENPNKPLCAFDVAGHIYVDEEIGSIPESPSSGFEHSLVDRLAELTRRKEICRGSLPPVELAGRNVLLIDNGIRTGSTVVAAARALRSFKVKRIVVAAPVANPESKIFVESEVDELISLAWPENFGHVGLWYKNFNRPSDDQIKELTESHRVE